MTDNIGLENIKLPPHDYETEKAVLCAVLMENMFINEYQSLGLTPGDFYSREHEKIYEAMLKLGKNIDVLTLGQELGEKYMDMLFDISTALITTGNSMEHAQIVKTKAIYRNAIKAAQHVYGSAMEEEPMEDVLNEIKQMSEGLVMSKPKATYLDEVDAVYTSFMDEEKGDIPTGLEQLDLLLGGGYETGNMVIIAARPSVGKTALMLNMAINMAQDKEIEGKIGFFSLEMRNRDIIKRAISRLSGINGYLLRKKYDDLDEEAQAIIAQSYDDVAALDLKLVDNDFRVENIVSTAKASHIKEPYSCIFVDYLGIVDTMKYYQNVPAKIAYISREFKRLAMELDIPVILGHQLNRNIENRRDPEPKLSDLRDSGAIEQDADTVLMMTREEGLQEDIHDITIYVRKQRNGATGDTQLEMHMPSQNIYTPVDKGEKVYNKKPRETKDGMF